MMPGTSGGSALQSVMASDGQVVVECPPPESLLCNTAPLVCVVCQRTFVNPSALRFHRIKVHKLIQNDADFAFSARRSIGKPLPVHYHCPAVTCKYHINKQRFFLELKNLKQHYMNTHAEKKFSCSWCGLKFGLQRQAARHEKTCNLKFVCAECGAVYETRDGLRIHCKRHGHISGFSTINSKEPDEMEHSRSTDPVMLSIVPLTPSIDPVMLSTVPVTSNTAAVTPSTVPVTSSTVPVIPNTLPVTCNLAPVIPSTVPVTSNILAVTPSVESVTSSTMPMTPSIVSATSSIVPVTPSVVQVTSSIMPMTPSIVPVTPNIFPVTSNAVPVTPSTVPLTSSAMPVTPSTMPVMPNTLPVTPCIVPVTSSTVPVTPNTVSITSHKVFTHPASTMATTVVPLPASGQSTMTHASVQAITCVSVQQTSSGKAVDLEPVLTSTTLNISDMPPASVVTHQAEPATVTMPLSYGATSTQLGIDGNKQTPPPAVCRPNKELTAADPPRSTKCSQPLLLPKPDALYILTQYPANQNNSLSQPVIMVFNNMVRPPPGPIPIAPMPLRLRMEASGLTARSVGTATCTSSPARSGRVSEVGFQGREMEVQTDAVQMANSYCGTDNVTETCELAVQTLAPLYAGHAMPCKDFVMAETQTMCNSQYYSAVEMQSQSSQVSPKAPVHQWAVHDGMAKPLSQDSQMPKQRRWKRAEVGSQTQGCGQRSVCVGTPPKRQKKRRNAAVSCSAAVKDVETQSDHPMQCVAVSQPAENQSLGVQIETDLSFLQSGMVGLPVGTVLSSSVGTAPTLPSHLESVGLGTTPLSLNDVGLEAVQPGVTSLGSAVSTPRPSIEMVSVCTDMSKANISVGTMPSPPLPLSDETFGTDFPSVSMNTIGTDPHSGFSGSSQRYVNLSAMFSQETQTSFWAEIQASIAENNATQTMESYLADSSMNADAASLTMPVVMESSGVQTCHAQNSQTQTWPELYTMPASECKSVGVGTALLSESHSSSSLFEGMESEGLSRSIGIDTQLFDDLFPEVSSRSVAISTPLFDNMVSSSASGSQQPVMGNAMFQPIDQRSVGVSPLGHDLTDLECLSRSNEG